MEAGQGLSAEAFSRAVLGLLDRLKVEATLQSWIDQANQAADPGLAYEYAQAYAWVGDIFDELVEVFGGQTAEVSQWVEVIGSALSQAEPGPDPADPGSGVGGFRRTQPSPGSEGRVPGGDHAEAVPCAPLPGRASD